ncbi:MAG: hypothetical protein QW692_02045 [Nitrososphaerota archaeon]
MEEIQEKIAEILRENGGKTTLQDLTMRLAKMVDSSYPIYRAILQLQEKQKVQIRVNDRALEVIALNV